MKVKEAIEYIEEIIDEYYYGEPPIIEEKLNKIIALLQQGEKYRQMWEELRQFGRGTNMKVLLHFNGEDLNNHIGKLEQKYFPKEAKQDEADNK